MMTKPKSEAPKVFCPKEGKKVPVWWCLGSFTQKKADCSHLIKATVIMAKNYAEVECDLQKEKLNNG